ncbi:hypothetical protein ACFQLX_21425 [Streptomyces polyrhachis]|uniref:Uncharacterized protein n=1 Tax=Streptomyces polyrhachis TaxID=1282885 RepID=A0ABW2GKK8_9ACTN
MLPHGADWHRKYHRRRRDDHPGRKQPPHQPETRHRRHQHQLPHQPPHQPPQEALATALTHPAHQHWTGLHVRHDEGAEHLDLWLATIQSDLDFGKLSVGATARDLKLADPALRWSGAALYDGATFAYLTTRPVDDDTDELGITAHGPGADKLLTQANDLLHRWNQQRPTQPTITAYPAAAHDDHLEAGARITRPDTQLTITW